MKKLKNAITSLNSSPLDSIKIFINVPLLEETEILKMTNDICRHVNTYWDHENLAFARRCQENIEISVDKA